MRVGHVSCFDEVLQGLESLQKALTTMLPSNSKRPRFFRVLVALVIVSAPTITGCFWHHHRVSSAYGTGTGVARTPTGFTPLRPTNTGSDVAQ
jgi:hypothetical protein